MVEVSLKINNENMFEYYTDRVPQKGEYLNISHEFINGEFVVNKVSNRIFQDKGQNIQSYVIVEASGYVEKTS